MHKGPVPFSELRRFVSSYHMTGFITHHRQTLNADILISRGTASLGIAKNCALYYLTRAECVKTNQCDRKLKLLHKLVGIRQVSQLAWSNLESIFKFTVKRNFFLNLV